jgi:hypothetical protein
VIDMAVGNERMERRINRRSAWIEVEGAVWVEIDHRIFDCRLRSACRVAQIDRAQGVQFSQFQRCKIGARAGAEIAARTLHPQHIDRLAGQWIAPGYLGGRVPAAGVCDALIASQQVRTIHQTTDRIECGGIGGVPTIMDMAEAR